MRIVHFVTHPIPYYVPLYRALTDMGHIELTVLFGDDNGIAPRRDPGFGVSMAWDVPLLGGYRSTFLDRLPQGLGKRQWGWRKPNPQVVTWLRLLRPDVVWVNGYTVPTSLLALAYGLAKRIPVLLRDDATLLKHRSSRRECIRRPVLGAIFRRCTCCYVGQHNRCYYEHYGVPGKRLHFVPHSVDNEFFRAQHAHWLPSRRELRCSFGVTDDRPVLLFVGRLIPTKDLDTLIRGFALVTAVTGCHLIVCGDGPLRSSLESRAAEWAPGRVTFTGFVNQGSLAKWYTAVDLLVLPSVGETWGLVVNEGMNFGLPAVVSDRVGCAPDLILEGRTGSSFRAGDVADLARAIERVIADSRIHEMGAAAREHIAQWSVMASAQGIARAAEAALGSA